MLGSFKKWIFGLVIAGVVIFLALIGFNVYLNYRKTTIKEKLEKERQAQKEQEEKDKELQREIAELDKINKGDWVPPKDSYEILTVEEIEHLGMLGHEAITCNHCNACEDCQEGEDCFKMQPKLLFNNKIKKYIRDVIENTVRAVNGDELESDGYNDNISKHLKRYNAALYGAPGTGKTELVNELVHHFHEKFTNPKIKPLKEQIKKSEELVEKLKKELKVINNKNPEEVTEEDKKKSKEVDKAVQDLEKRENELKELEKKHFIPPVFKINGVQLQTGGATVGQPSPEVKLIKIIEKCKKEYFKGAVYSDRPYVVFIEEADQGKNTLTVSSGKPNLLEEYKNFLSTSKDKVGLKAKAQDPDSIIIIATNNFDQIDPAVVRRGRLGEKLNFNWTPALLEEYGNRGDSEWEKINWPKNDLGWQFVGNTNYQDLYFLTSRFGYSVFANELTVKKVNRREDMKIVNKANQIISSYKELIQKKEFKEFKERELGTNPTGKKIKERKQDEKTGEWKEKEVDEKACNWLLHFLYTFHDYNDKNNLDSFTSAQQIIRYDFGEAFRTQEAIWGIYRRIGEECNILFTNNDLIAKAAEGIHGIKDLMLETSSVQDQFREMKDKLNETIVNSDNMKINFKTELAILKSNIERGTAGSSSEISSLNSRISALENRISSLSSSSSGGSSGGGVGSVNVSDYKKKLDDFIEELRGNLSSMSSTEIFNKLIRFYNENKSV